MCAPSILLIIIHWQICVPLTAFYFILFYSFTWKSLAG